MGRVDLNRRESAILILMVAIAIVAVLITIYEMGGFAAQPPYVTWCDSPSTVDGQRAANRIYESNTGAITVVPLDKTC
jgi:hypothetical protein